MQDRRVSDLEKTKNKMQVYIAFVLNHTLRFRTMESFYFYLLYFENEKMNLTELNGNLLPPHIEFIESMTKEYCEQLSQAISLENQKKPHMLEKSPEKIFTDSKDHGFVWLHQEGKLVWYFGLMNSGEFVDESVYEAGSLYIHENYRNQGLAKVLMKSLLETYKKNSIFLITNVPSVKHLSLTIWMLLEDKDWINKELLWIIEWGGVLLEDDDIFINQGLVSELSVYDFCKFYKNYLKIQEFRPWYIR